MLFGTQGLDSLKCTIRASVVYKLLYVIWNAGIRFIEVYHSSKCGCINYYMLFGTQGLDSLKCTIRASVVYKLLYVIWNAGIRFIEVYHSSKCGV